MDWHPGISMHRIRSNSGVMGVLFGLGMSLVCLLGVPQARGFLLASLPFAFLVAVVLWYWHRHKPVDLILMDRLTGRQPEEKVQLKRT